MERLAFAEYVTQRDGEWLPDAPGLSLVVPAPRTHGQGKSTCKQNPTPPEFVSSTCRPTSKPSWSKPIHRFKAF
jgi:hypothetical protein